MDGGQEGAILGVKYNEQEIDTKPCGARVTYHIPL